MPGTKERTKITDRYTTVARMYLQGAQQSEIAQALGVDRSRIRRYLQTIRQSWLASSVRDFDAAREEELCRIALREREAWAAWVRSQQPRESTIAESSNGRKKVSRHVAQQVGDPRFLQVIERCSEQRAAILGLEAPKKYLIDWDALTDFQLERISRGDPLMAVLTESAQPPQLSQSPIAEA